MLIGGRSAHIPADYRDVNAGGMFITQHGTIEISADGKRPPGLQIRIVYSPNSTADPKQGSKSAQRGCEAGGPSRQKSQLSDRRKLDQMSGLRAGRPVSQYAGSEDCIGSAGAEPHA